MRRVASVAMIALLAVTMVTIAATWSSSGPTVLTVASSAHGDARWTPDRPLFVLVVGDDARDGVGCGCTDAIHVVGIPAGGGQAAMIDIPRDTRVNIPGVGTRRINAAWQGGADRAATVVGNLVGVPISYVVSVNFVAFPKLVDAIGGVTVDVPVAMNDRNSGAVFPKGPVHMNGAQALAFSRNRHLGAGDLTRTENQGRFILATLSQLRGGDTGPVATMAHLATATRFVDVHGMGTVELFRLGRLALGIDPARIANVVMPAAGAMIGGAAYVVPTAAAAPLFADFADDAILQTHGQP